MPSTDYNINVTRIINSKDCDDKCSKFCDNKLPDLFQGSGAVAGRVTYVAPTPNGAIGTGVLVKIFTPQGGQNANDFVGQACLECATGRWVAPKLCPGVYYFAVVENADNDTSTGGATYDFDSQLIGPYYIKKDCECKRQKKCKKHHEKEEREEDEEHESK